MVLVADIGASLVSRVRLTRPLVDVACAMDGGRACDWTYAYGNVMYCLRYRDELCPMVVLARLRAGLESAYWRLL